VDVAFAVWDGSRQERDGLKSVSAFIQLTITPEDPPRRAVPASQDWPGYAPPNPLLAIGVGFVVVALIGSALGWAFLSRGKRSSDAPEE
jgi:hypothetical protein